VVAIEPHPENYEFLLRNIKLNSLKNVIALNMAAWDSETDLKLFVGDKHGHHNIKKDFSLGSLVVRAKPLDEILTELGVERVDFIKIDVEGSELEVLRGLTRTLKRYRPKVVVEIWGDPREVEKLMDQLEYGMRQIAPQYYVLEYFAISK